MITLWINDQPHSLEAPCSVAQALELLQYTPGTVVVAVNECFVPRSTYPQHLLQEQDRMEILSPVTGG